MPFVIDVDPVPFTLSPIADPSWRSDDQNGHGHGIPASAVPPNDGPEVGTAHRREALGLRARLPRWALPALLVGAVAVAALLALGVSPLWIVFGGLFIGMHLFMHGGHGGHAGHDGPPGQTPPSDRRPRRE